MSTLEELEGTRWSGQKRLWLDPEAPPEVCEATVSIDADALRYTWSREGNAHEGRIAVDARGDAEWSDSWHATKTMRCARVSPSPALVNVLGAYAAPSGPDWHWRIALALRPSGELVIQMWNGTPWGEEHRAVELVAQRA